MTFIEELIIKKAAIDGEIELLRNRKWFNPKDEIIKQECEEQIKLLNKISSALDDLIYALQNADREEIGDVA